MARILIIDDDEQILNLMEAILEREGHDITAFSDGNKVGEHCRDQVPDLIISDLNIPGTDGMEMITELKRDLPDIQIIVVTGEGMGSAHENPEVAKKIGELELLQKPFSRKELLKAVNKIIK